MAVLKAAIPKGTRDFLPEQMRQRHRVMDVIRRVYERHGFAPIETPARGNGPDEPSTSVALSPAMTVPAKFTASARAKVIGFVSFAWMTDAAPP